jgi:hypothetical protein
LPKRWIVERTFAWISRNRRLARDFERYVTTVAAFVRLAMIRIMLRRLGSDGSARRAIRTEIGCGRMMSVSVVRVYVSSLAICRCGCRDHHAVARAFASIGAQCGAAESADRSSLACSG